MAEQWEEQLMCAVVCARCGGTLNRDAQRILSVYDNTAICMACKKAEEKRADYGETSKNMISQCMYDAELQKGDPGGYCFHHFYPYTC